VSRRPTSPKTRTRRTIRPSRYVWRFRRGIAAQLALRVAEEADGKVKALSDEMLAKIRAKGNPPFNLSRAIHRKEHLDEIEQLLGAPGGGRR
jgi:hypothetical protein